MRIKRPGNLGGYRGFAGTGIIVPPPASLAPTLDPTLASRSMERAGQAILRTGGHGDGRYQTLPGRLTLHEADWMRSSGTVASRVDAIPVDFNEGKYLELHPDVAHAVDEGVMPSGLWHYMKYGKKEGRAFAGWRRPGFLSGVFSNWKSSD